MNGKLIAKKLLSQILYFLVFTVVMMIVGNFIPNPIYMIIIGGIAIAGLVYLRRSKRGEPEDEYLAGTTSDDLTDDIKYLFGGFSEFRAEAASMKIMDLVSPVMCTYFAFVVPSAIGIYWMYRNILAFVQQFVLSKLYPTPKFTEEELKEAEREYMGKSKKPSGSGTKTERDPNKPKPRSLHRIDFDDDDDDNGGESSKPALAEPKEKGDSPIDSAPLKKDDK